MLTGWCSGSASDALRGLPRQEVLGAAWPTLRRVLGTRVPRPAAAYFHDWHSGTLCRGAYSYVPVGGSRAKEELSRAVEETLYFAGEANDRKSFGGTVHGAMLAGRAVGERILERSAAPAGRGRKRSI
ncbi:MAG: FAD-dependent oxidoreductase [Acidobacteria bacterium]|nr:FAD-dependent oxidoreductase [Acidobacteriota bacterium]